MASAQMWPARRFVRRADVAGAQIWQARRFGRQKIPRAYKWTERERTRKLSKEREHATERFYNHTLTRTHTSTAVTAANMRRRPTQNGSDRRRYLSFAHAQQASELALRPSDRQVHHTRARSVACASVDWSVGNSDAYTRTYSHVCVGAVDPLCLLYCLLTARFTMPHPKQTTTYALIIVCRYSLRCIVRSIGTAGDWMRVGTGTPKTPQVLTCVSLSLSLSVRIGI